jgi:hypothetical protein
VRLNGRRVAWFAAVTWLCANVALLCVGGRERIAADARLSREPSVAARRAKVWGQSLEKTVLAFETALDDAAQHRFARVLLVAPPPRNVFESLAWHKLFPAVVEMAAAEDVETLRHEAIERRADAMIYPQSATAWRVVDVRELPGDGR